jgi:hypothetical protein
MIISEHNTIRYIGIPYSYFNMPKIVARKVATPGSNLSPGRPKKKAMKGKRGTPRRANSQWGLKGFLVFYVTKSQICILGFQHIMQIRPQPFFRSNMHQSNIVICMADVAKLSVFCEKPVKNVIFWFFVLIFGSLDLGGCSVFFKNSKSGRYYT